MRRFIYKKWDQSTDPAKCWYCRANTLFYIFDKKTGEDFFCCSPCALKHYKIKRLKGLLKKYPLRQKKTILEQNPLLKNPETPIINLSSEVSNAP